MKNYQYPPEIVELIGAARGMPSSVLEPCASDGTCQYLIEKRAILRLQKALDDIKKLQIRRAASLKSRE